MKQFTKGMKRGLAMILAIVMVFSAMQTGLIPTVHAHESEDKHFHLSELLVMTENYGELLKEEEKLIIGSGSLNGDMEITYVDPDSGAVSVNTDKKTITAKVSNGWVPVSATIVVGEEVEETVELKPENGDYVGTYTFAENAFSVKVTYKLHTNVETAKQLALLNAAYYLAQDNANIGVLRAGTVETILSTLVAEMEELKNVEGIALDGATAVELINQLATTGIELPALTLDGSTTVLRFEPDLNTSADDAAALLADKNDGDGKLALGNVLDKYSKLSNLQLLDQHSDELLPALKSNYVNIDALAYDNYGLAYVQLKLSNYIDNAAAAIAQTKEQLAETEADLAAAEAALAELKAAEALLTYAKEELAKYNAAVEKIADAREALAAYNEAIAKLDEAITMVGDYYDAKEALENQSENIETARETIAAYNAAAIVIDTLGGLDAAKAMLTMSPGNTNLANAIALYESVTPEQIAEMQAAVDTYDQAVKDLETAKQEADEQLQAAGVTLSFGNETADLAVLNGKKTELTNTANAALAPYGATVDNAAAKLAEAEAAFEEEANKLLKEKLEEAGIEADVTVDNADAFIAEKEAELDATKAAVNAELQKIDPSATVDNADQYIAAAKQQIAEAKAYIEAVEKEGGMLDQLEEVHSALGALISALKRFCTGAKPAYECGKWYTTEDDLLLDTLDENAYNALNAYVNALEEPTLYTEDNVAESLYVATTEVEANVAMSNVNITVMVYDLDGKVDSNELATETTAQKSVKITLTNGTSKADVQAAVDAQLAEIVDGLDVTWANYELVSETELAGDLETDVDYVVVYNPVKHTYTITGEVDATATVYHGYQLTLPTCQVAGEVYEYTVNGAFYTQGAVVTVDQDLTITSEQGKKRDTILVKELLIDKYPVSYLTGSNASLYSIGDKAQAILACAAVKSPSISIRVIDVSKITAKIEDGKVSVDVASYESGIDGMTWVTDKAYFVGTNAVVDMNGAAEAAIPAEAAGYDKIQVTYKLEVSAVAESTVKELLDLPETLVSEYNAQKSALDTFWKNQKSNLATLSTNAELLGMATSLLDEEKDADLIAALNQLNDNIDDNGQLKLYVLMDEYDIQGMAYYYKNSEDFLVEINALTESINELWPEKVEDQDALIERLKDVIPASYAEKIEEVRTLLNAIKPALNTVRADLTAPNANIDTTVSMSQLGTLVTALESTGKTTHGITTDKTPVITTDPEQSPSVDALDKVSVSVSVNYSGQVFTAGSVTFDIDHVLTAADIAKIEEAFEAALQNALAKYPYLDDTAFYTYTKGARLEVGTKLTKAVSLSDSYAIKEYTVEIEGEEAQTITIEDLEIVLPTSSNPVYKWEYTIDGAAVTGEYTFNAEQIKTLFVDGTYTVTKTVINLKDQEVEELDKELGENASIGKDPNNDGEYVLNINIPLDNPAAMQDAVMALIQGGYSYIWLNDEAFLFGTDLYTQTLINVLMANNVGTDTIISIAENGGGTLFTAKMALGKNDEDNGNITGTMVVTLTGESAQLNTAANALKKVQNYLDVKFTETGLVVTTTLPEKAYQAYLAGLILTDQRDLKNLNDINGEVAIGYIQDVIDPVMTNPDLDLDTFVNTLKIFGYNVDASMVEPYFDGFVAKYNALNWVYDETGAATALQGGTAAIETILAGCLGEMASLVEFKGSVSDPDNVTIPTELKLTNLAKDYEAVFADVKADGITNKIGLTDDLGSKKFVDKAVVVLLADIDADLAFGATTVLDLNGYAINGNVSCSSGTLYIVDSSLDSTNVGGVTGNVNGNVVISAGTYSADVSKYLSGGYSQDSNGTVKNDYYTIEKDTEGNYTITLIAGAVSPDNLPSIKTMAVDILMDLIFNIYNKGAMWIDGNLVYDIALENIVDIYESDSKLDALLDAVVNGSATQNPWFNVEDLAKIYNQLVKDLTNFANIAEGENLAQYTLTTAPWEISVFVDGDHVSAGAGALASDTKDTTITIVLSDDDKADTIRDVAAELDSILTIESLLEMSQIKNGSTVKIEAIYSQANVVIDLSKDANYMVILGKLLANVATGDKLTALNEGLEAYETYGTTSLLKKAIDVCTVSDLLTAIADENAASVLSGYKTVYQYAVKLVGAVIRKLEIQNKGGRTFGSMLNGEYATYVLDKENMSISRSRSLRGYTLSVDASVPYASVTVILCSDCDHANVKRTEAKDPTCTADGNIEYWYCPDCGSYFEDVALTVEITEADTVIAATGHTYEVSWVWEADYSKATATFTCACGVFVTCEDTDIEHNEVSAPTCSTPGTTEHTAKVTFEDKEYTDTEVETTETIDHVVVDSNWTWTGNDEDGYTAADLIITCKDCGEVEVDGEELKTETTEASCTADGQTVYTASVNFQGVDYSDSKTVVLPKTGHSYEAAWNWADDYTSVIDVTFTCSNSSNGVACDFKDVVTEGITVNNTEAGIFVGVVEYEGKIYTDVRILDHEFDAPVWTWADDYLSATAKFTCKDCGETYEITTQSEVEVIEVSCLQEGKKIYTASVTFNGQTYGAEPQEVITAAATGHKLVGVLGIAPTCTEDGINAHWLCLNCGLTFSDSDGKAPVDLLPRPATGHSYGEPVWYWTEDYSAASAVFECGTCGHKHSADAVVEKDEENSAAATCTVDGKNVYVATVTVDFGAETYTNTKTEILTAPGHDGDWVPEKDATCTEKGLEKYECSCGYTDEREIEMLEHAYVETVVGPTCAADGYTLHKCSDCGTEYRDSFVSKTNEHSYKTNVVAPTCTMPGYTEHTCSVCGDYYTDTEVAATGHKYTNYTSNGDATCTTDGTKTATCDNGCGESHTVVDTGSAKGHKFTNYVSNNDATCTTDGTKTATCDNGCGGTHTVVDTGSAKGHNYTCTEDDWTWTGYSSAKVTVQCANCGDEKTLDAAVTSKTTQPANGVDGKIVYTAAAYFNGQTFTDIKEEVLKYQLSIDKVTIGTNTAVVGSVVKDQYIIVDAIQYGVKVSDFLSLLKVEYKADQLNIKLSEKEGVNDLVYNGAVLTITASNKDGESVERKYTVIVLGDVNGNGKVETADTSLIVEACVGNNAAPLTKEALMAADVNRNGGLDVADASKNLDKILFWDTYASLLK